MEMKPIENTKEFVEYCKTVNVLHCTVDFITMSHDGCLVQLVYKDEKGTVLFTGDRIFIGPDDTLNLNVPLVPKITINDC